MPVQEIQGLQEWANANDPSQTNLIYKDGFWKQIMFVRDQIPETAFDIYGQKVAMNLLDKGIKVISTHTSKSVKLPVFHITMPNGDEFVMRYNFYDWKISVKAKSPINVDFLNLFDGNQKVVPNCCEGFPSEWIFGSYEENHQQFSIELRASENYLFTFFWIYFQKVASRRKFT
jgi:hypothetical protein